MGFDMEDEALALEQTNLFQTGPSADLKSARRAEICTAPLFSPATHIAAEELYGDETFPNFALFARSKQQLSSSVTHESQHLQRVQGAIFSNPTKPSGAGATEDTSYSDPNDPSVYSYETSDADPSDLDEPEHSHETSAAGYSGSTSSSDEAERRNPAAGTRKGPDQSRSLGVSSDERIFLNTNAPWSAFICGSQGSGKSYSLTAMLENCLMQTAPDHKPSLGALQDPLTGLVFHYDPLSASANGLPCEAASIASLGIQVRVLVSLTNYPNMKQMYQRLDSRIKVRPLLFKSEHLDVKTMMALMAADNEEAGARLYMHSVRQYLRESFYESGGSGINWERFRKRCLDNITDRNQLTMLMLRFQLIENFIKDTRPVQYIQGGKRAVPNEWKPTRGQLTIVDLSCPFVDRDTACNLFDICLGIFQQQDSKIGKVIALDEAHKFMTESAAATKLTESVKTAIRMQRHRALRVIVSTQEPTISPTLLDLCSITLIHRFSSPAWYVALKGHLGAIAIHESKSQTSDKDGGNAQNEDLFTKIAQLNTGEALLCAPTAMLEIGQVDGHIVPKKLGTRALKVMIRQRYSTDIGVSTMAHMGSESGSGN